MNSLENSTKFSNSQLNEDFWAEIDSISESGDVSQEVDEESSTSKSLENVAEADWLKQAGLEDIVHSLQDESMTASSSSLNDLLFQSISIPLTERQAKTVKKRFDTLRTNIIKQKGSKRGQEVVQIISNTKQRPDVRSIFNKDNTTSLPIIISKREITEYDGNALCASRDSLEVPNESISRRSSSPDLKQMSRERTNSTPPDYGKFKAIDKIYDKNLSAISKSAGNVKKESPRFSWSGHKKAFKVNRDRRNSSSFLDSESNESGIETLSMKYNSSLKRQEIPFSQESNGKNSNQWSDPVVNDYSNSDHITAEGLGIESQTDLRLNSYVVRLEDLKTEMHKKVKTLALIELSSVLDMHGLEYEKIKRTKLRKRIKKNLLFGAYLTDIYDMDRRRDNNCRIPSILNALLNYIRINGLHEEGIFRITGSQNRVQALKEELESLYHYYYNNSLRENNEEICGLLSKYSIYDICSVLKHFIRELPDPLLSCELLEAFLLVPKVNDYLQQIQILNLLVLLLSDAHRNSLEAILILLKDIVMHENLNKMSVHNIATIMAPNLFPNLVQKKVTKGGEQKEMALILERAKDSFLLTKMLINNQSVIFHVPPYLIAQIQRRKK